MPRSRYTGLMPLFEYECGSCGRQFEFLTLADQRPACPDCGGTELQKQLSVFAVATAAGGNRVAASAPGPCGTCGDPRGPGACSIH